jgi:hypothetical protein
MSKKTIADLKIYDTVYYLGHSSDRAISETRIKSISTSEIITEYGHRGKISISDFTAWQFEATYSGPYIMYLNKVDLLSSILKNAKEHLSSKIEAHKKAIDSVLDAQKHVLKIEFEIINSK